MSDYKQQEFEQLEQQYLKENLKDVNLYTYEKYFNGFASEENYHRKEEICFRSIEEIADAHGNAACISAMDNHIVYEADSQEDFIEISKEEYESENFFCQHPMSSMKKHITSLIHYDELQVSLRLYFEVERLIYEKAATSYKELLVSNELERRLEKIWEGVSDITYEYNKDQIKYPLRNTIYRHCRTFMTEVKSTNLSRMVDDSYFVREVLNLCEQFQDEQYQRRRNWNTFENKFLSLWRIYRPGSYGHLLWIYLYVSELTAYHSMKYSRLSEGLDLYQKQPGVYWEDYSLNDENLELVYDQFRSFQMEKSKQIESFMMMQNPIVRGAIFDEEWEIKRIKSILYRDPTLRKSFIYKNFSGNSGDGPTSNNGNGGYNGNGSKCYALLTNGRKRYLAISGFEKSYLLLCVSVFKTKANFHVTVIGEKEYGKSLYAWKPLPHTAAISYDESELVLKSSGQFFSHKNKRIRKPNDYKRMFSCAERRLVDTFKQVAKQGKYRIISRWEPCYMCEQILKINKIPCQFIEPHVNINNRFGCLDEWGMDVYLELHP